MTGQRSGVRDLMRREFHLNALAYIIIMVLIGISGVLTFMVLTGVATPDRWILNNDIFRAVFIGLLIMVVIYMIDQHRRLRTELLCTHERLEGANVEIRSACERLSFAQHAAEVMTSLEQEDALEQVLRESCEHFASDAAAVVGDDVTLYAKDGAGNAAAHSAVLQVALDAVRAGKPLSISNSKTGSEALATPLRIKGELKAVACLWRRGEPFDEDQLEGLGLVARIIELSTENRLLLAEANDQLTGTLRTLAALIDKRITDYSLRSASIAEHAVAVAEAMGFTRREVSDIRIAAMLLDVGMLEIPEGILRAQRSLTPRESAEIRLHPTKGAEIARTASFSPEVQHAIHDHHERLNGTGYPSGRRGNQIGTAARILAVCDVYNSMTTERPHRAQLDPEQAVAELASGMGTLYDSQVVKAFLKVIDYHHSGQAARLATDSGSLVLARDLARVTDIN